MLQDQGLMFLKLIINLPPVLKRFPLLVEKLIDLYFVIYRLRFLPVNIVYFAGPGDESS